MGLEPANKLKTDTYGRPTLSLLNSGAPSFCKQKLHRRVRIRVHHRFQRRQSTFTTSTASCPPSSEEPGPKMKMWLFIACCLVLYLASFVLSIGSMIKILVRVVCFLSGFFGTFLRCLGLCGMVKLILLLVAVGYLFG
ncbi:hypothetical protein F4680DRAFT_431487 [Xylaria scruposa]|nr:hypothetical protein F4680DRAFT_431487 [Xylaria scruposa]